MPRCPCGWGRCTLNSTAARTPARPRPSAATGAANTCCARPNSGAPRQPSAAVLRLPGSRAEAALAAGASAAVPRHPARQLHRLGPPGRGTELCRHQRRPRNHHWRGRGRTARRGAADVPAQRCAACAERRPGTRGRGASGPAASPSRPPRWTADMCWTTASSGRSWMPTASWPPSPITPAGREAIAPGSARQPAGAAPGHPQRMGRLGH